MKFLSLSFPDTPATPPWVKHFLGMISFLSAATDISSLFSSHLYSKKQWHKQKVKNSLLFKLHSNEMAMSWN